MTTGDASAVCRLGNVTSGLKFKISPFIVSLFISKLFNDNSFLEKS